jgi:hypothetical protein
MVTLKETLKEKIKKKKILVFEKKLKKKEIKLN